MTGLGLSVVKQWSARGKWLAHTRAEPPPLPKSMQPVIVTGVTTPADALANTLADDDKATRTALSKAMRKGAEHAGSLSGDEVLASARNVHELAKGASTIHGWDASRPDVRINVFADGMKIADAVEIESEATRIESQ